MFIQNPSFKLLAEQKSVVHENKCDLHLKPFKYLLFTGKLFLDNTFTENIYLPGKFHITNTLRMLRVAILVMKSLPAPKEKRTREQMVQWTRYVLQFKS